MGPEKRIAELERQVAEFKTLRLLVGGLAHDFNNLLTAIAGHAALLRSEARAGDEVRESAAVILKAAERATAIAGKLLGIARRGQVRKASVNLHETIAEVSALLRPTTKRSILIEQKLNAPAACTLADPDQIHQLILNLALNARDAMPRGGSLTFETDLLELGPPGEGPYLVVSVKDTGCGIPKDVQERIFEPFFTTRQAEKGTGLGLTVVAGIVEQHNGFIRLESEAGRGSTFRVYLPLLERKAAASQ